jgi:hypothetical protein
MTESTDNAASTRVLVSIAAFVTVVAGLKEAKTVFVPFLLSVMGSESSAKSSESTSDRPIG